MTQQKSLVVRIAVLAGAALLLAACGGSNGQGAGNTSNNAATATSTAPPPTSTRTALPTTTATVQPPATLTATVPPSQTVSATPTTNTVAVAGQIVVDGQVRSDPDDGLNTLPPESMPPGYRGFDRGLGNADWVVDDGTASGTTDADGRFSIAGLTPGQHTVTVTKTVDGNLMQLSLIIMVGSDGSADVIAEVTWGLVRTTSTYTQGGAAMRAVFTGSGAHAITADGAVVELSDGYRTLRDRDGDGKFEPDGCTPAGQLYLCDDASDCGPDRICGCIGSCPFCEDCRIRACVPARSPDPTCGPDGPCNIPPYACSDGDICKQTGGTCACIASCPVCDDCQASACVPSCEPIEVGRIDVLGPDRLVAGQHSSTSATVYFSDGTAMVVTALATWASSDENVAAVDGWGRLLTLAVGSTAITGALGDATSGSFALTVVERPTLRHIYLQNGSCYYPDPYADGTVRPVPPVMDDAMFAPPSCGRVLPVGRTIQFIAMGEFDTGYYEDLTDEVEWRAEPAAVGGIDGGLFTAAAAGTASISAALDGVESDVLDVRVVDHATVVELSIYPTDHYYMGPIAIREDECIGCANYLLTLLSDHTVRFSATARYDTGEWRDVTASVTWHSSDTAVAAFDETGELTAGAAGLAAVDATFEDVTSTAVSVHVVAEATLQSLYVYPESQDRVVGKGEQTRFIATGYYDIGFSSDVTADAEWHSSNEAVGGFDTPGVFTGRSAGTAAVWAVLDGQRSDSLPIEVYATSELDYCDSDNVNRAAWSDDFNRVTLESDCAEYTPPDIVSLRFSVTETQRPGGIFDPCLDLYAYRGETKIRTIREEGCGDPFLAPGAPNRDEAALRYQLTAFWDLKDANGETVPPGDYTIIGRFYLYYDPIVQLPIQVK
jgi:hypothetical protein